MNVARTGRTVRERGPGCYAQWLAAEIGTTTDRLERAWILDWAGSVGGLRALDVGSGDGQLALQLREHGAKVTGIARRAQPLLRVYGRSKCRHSRRAISRYSAARFGHFTG